MRPEGQALMLSLDARPRLPRGVKIERRDSEWLLLHPEAPRWAVLNATGLEVARLCDGQHSFAQIAESIAGRWGHEPRDVLDDVQRCVDGLRLAGFLDASTPEPSPARGRAWRLHLYLTEGCNLRCRHCAVVDGARSARALGGHVVRRLVDEASSGGAEAIALSGGEPLLHEDALDLLGYAALRGKTLLASNATLIDERAAARLVEMGIVVQVSLDGATPEVHDAIRGPGAFDRAWRGIDALVQRGVRGRLALNATLMRPNLAQALDIVNLAKERGVAAVRFSLVQHLGRAADRWVELAPRPEECAATYRRLYARPDDPQVAVSEGLLGLELEPPAAGLWCGLGHLLLVDAGGDIYPCSMLTDAEFRLGNVAETSLEEALASDKLRALVALCARRVDEIEACRACSWRRFCQAGCPAGVWAQQRSWYGTDDLCDLRRELFEELIFSRAGLRSPADRLPSACDGS